MADRNTLAGFNKGDQGAGQISTGIGGLQQNVMGSLDKFNNGQMSIGDLQKAVMGNQSGMAQPPAGASLAAGWGQTPKPMTPTNPQDMAYTAGGFSPYAGNQPQGMPTAGYSGGSTGGFNRMQPGYGGGAGLGGAGGAPK